MTNSIQVYITFETSFWVAIFERNDAEGYAVTRHVFGSEPTDPEIYAFITENYASLHFSEPQKGIKLDIQRKNFKRMSREVRKLMAKAEKYAKHESLSQEALRLQLEENKKMRKSASKEQKEAEKAAKFTLKQEKKKKKKRGH